MIPAAGVKVKVTPLQVVVESAGIKALATRETVTVNGVPEQPPGAVGVTK
jgi:hypothetical protein